MPRVPVATGSCVHFNTSLQGGVWGHRGAGGGAGGCRAQQKQRQGVCETCVLFFGGNNEVSNAAASFNKVCLSLRCLARWKELLEEQHGLVGQVTAARRGGQGTGQETRQGRSAASRCTHFRLIQAQWNKRIF